MATGREIVRHTGGGIQNPAVLKKYLNDNDGLLSADMALAIIVPIAAQKSLGIRLTPTKEDLFGLAAKKLNDEARIALADLAWRCPEAFKPNCPRLDRHWSQETIRTMFPCLTVKFPLPSHFHWVDSILSSQKTNHLSELETIMKDNEFMYYEIAKFNRGLVAGEPLTISPMEFALQNLNRSLSDDDAAGRERVISFHQFFSGPFMQLIEKTGYFDACDKDEKASLICLGQNLLCLCRTYEALSSPSNRQQQQLLLEEKIAKVRRGEIKTVNPEREIAGLRHQWEDKEYRGTVAVIRAMQLAGCCDAQQIDYLIGQLRLRFPERIKDIVQTFPGVPGISESVHVTPPNPGWVDFRDPSEIYSHGDNG